MSAPSALNALIVDDNSMSRQTLSTVLKQSVKVENIYQSGTTRDAIALLKQQERVDWIFTETQVDGGDCFQFIEQLKTIPSSKDAAIIMVSSNANRDVLLKAASLGVVDFVKKPFTANTLTVKLRRLIDGKTERRAQRVALFEAISADLKFKAQTVKSHIIDLSVGGCLVKCEAPVIAQIYEPTLVNINIESSPILVQGELVRLERSIDDGQKKILAAFEFRGASDESKAQLTQLIGRLNPASGAKANNS